VIVGMRLSKSGQPMAAGADPEGRATPVKPGAEDEGVAVGKALPQKQQGARRAMPRPQALHGTVFSCGCGAAHRPSAAALTSLGASDLSLK